MEVNGVHEFKPAAQFPAGNFPSGAIYLHSVGAQFPVGQWSSTRVNGILKRFRFGDYVSWGNQRKKVPVDFADERRNKIEL